MRPNAHPRKVYVFVQRPRWSAVSFLAIVVMCTAPLERWHPQTDQTRFVADVPCASTAWCYLLSCLHGSAAQPRATDQCSSHKVSALRRGCRCWSQKWRPHETLIQRTVCACKVTPESCAAHDVERRDLGTDNSRLLLWYGRRLSDALRLGMS